MKNWINIFSILTITFFLLSNTEADNGNSAEARINTYKHECKQLLKPFRYEGSRVTYYNVQKEALTKNVEAFLILDTEYKFIFSGKETSTKVTVKIFDSQDLKKRVLLKEIKNIHGKNVTLSSKDLMDVYRKKVSANERLKAVYIEYTIAGGKAKNEAVIMVVGYKD